MLRPAESQVKRKLIHTAATRNAMLRAVAPERHREDRPTAKLQSASPGWPLSRLAPPARRGRRARPAASSSPCTIPTRV